MATDVFVSTRTALHPAGSPVEAARVSLHTSTGVFITAGLTDATGLVFLGNRAAGSYEIRVTPPSPGYVSGDNNRQAITVPAATSVAFDVVIVNASLPVAAAANFCRCSGYFIDLSGAPARALSLTFTQTESMPVLDISGNSVRGLVPNRTVVSTNSSGYAVVDLLRGQQYTVTVGPYGHDTWTVVVPDLSSCPLPDLVYPYTSAIEYFDSGGNLLMPPLAPTVSVTQGETVTLDIETVFRSGARFSGVRGVGLQADTGHWRVSLSLHLHQLIIEGLSPGAVVVTPVPTEYQLEGEGVIPIPDQTFGGVLTITVVDDPLIDDLTPPSTPSLGSILYDSEA